MKIIIAIAMCISLIFGVMIALIADDLGLHGYYTGYAVGGITMIIYFTLVVLLKNSK